MDLRRLAWIKLTWVLILELCVFVPIVNSQIQGCSFEGIDQFLCLNHGNNSATEICCRNLNKFVRAGYDCLCSLVASSIPDLSTPFSLPLPNCDIPAPPLALCPVVAPMPVVIPPAPAIPKEAITQPAAPSQNGTVPAPPPPPVPSIDNSTVALQPHSIDSPVPELCTFKNGNESSNGKHGVKVLMHTSLFLSLLLHACVLFVSLIF